MPTIEVTIGDGGLEDVDLDAAQVQMGSRRVRLNYLSRGTADGMPSVAIAVQKDDGTWFVFETTARALEMAAAVIRGAAARDGIEL